MRALLAVSVAAVGSGSEKVSEKKEEPVKSCDAESCPWKPYSNSEDFTKDAWLIFAILLCLLFLALTLNALVRCLIRRRCRRNQQSPPPPTQYPVAAVDADMTSKKPPPPPTDIKGDVVVFSAELILTTRMMKQEMNDCAICLSEFEEGERVKVLDGCKHGFHLHCIKEWLLSAHSSCPICRGSITMMLVV